MTINVNPIINPSTTLTQIAIGSILSMSRTYRVPIFTKWSPALTSHTNFSLSILYTKKQRFINDIITKLGGIFKRYFTIIEVIKVLKTKRIKYSKTFLLYILPSSTLFLRQFFDQTIKSSG